MSWKQIEAAFVQAFSAFSMVFTASFLFCHFSSKDFSFGFVAAIATGFAIGIFARTIISSLGPNEKGVEQNG